MEQTPRRGFRNFVMIALAGLFLGAVPAFILSTSFSRDIVVRPGKTVQGAVAISAETAHGVVIPAEEIKKRLQYQPRFPLDTSGSTQAVTHLRWTPDASLEEIRDSWQSVGPRMIDELDKALPAPGKCDSQRLLLQVCKVNVLNMQGQTDRAYELLRETRSWVEKNDALSELGLYTVIFLQGVTAMRRGETENCIMCRGESSCIVPISAAAVHTVPTGSRLAILHFTEYLEQFPDDVGIRWLLNLAHMTLGEHPHAVDSKLLLSIDQFTNSEFDIGKFRDIGHQAGVDRFGMSGGGVLEDFDNDGRLDLAITNYDPGVPMGYWRNSGDGTFEDRAKSAGLSKQLGGQTVIPTDYDNDGWMDMYISRGAWFLLPMRQSLLRNNGDGTFTDVTEEAGLLGPLNVHVSRWADYDNDGWIDVFLVCEKQSIRLCRNRGNGTFEVVTDAAGLWQDPKLYCKGAEWIDYDNDDYPDLFVDNMSGDARLYHNNRNGTFTNVTESMGIDGPKGGFSCCAWDYDNDGWLDIFATCYDLSLGDVVKGMLGQPHNRYSNRLWHNVNGKRFENKTTEAGLDMVFATMGSNFGDFDNDGFLDFYLGTGSTDLSVLVPNRMFKNVAGRRFADITASSRTGNLQKGHSVSCGDWDRDGDVDIFIQMGGAVVSDSYHNVLFENPGQGNHWLTMKLIGKKSNRSAVGARIKVVTAGERPLTIHRHISSGSSWGANPLQQTIGLARADKVALLEIHWPTSGTTQVFRDIAINQSIEITEFASDYRKLDWKPIPPPK
jgi:ASPIC and UnbV/FG-GAP-like repeat